MDNSVLLLGLSQKILKSSHPAKAFNLIVSIEKFYPFDQRRARIEVI